MDPIIGAFSQTLALTFAYIADCTTVEERTTAYGRAMATFGLSFVFAPFIGGVISKTLGRQILFLIVVIINAVSAIYTIAFVPESLPLARKKVF